MRTTLLTLAAIASLKTTSAYIVDLYAGIEACNSADEGEWIGSLADDSCSTMGVGEASSAVITMQSGDGPNTAVVFYSSSDCNPSNEIALSNGGCVAIAGQGAEGSYQSFNVIGGEGGDTEKTITARSTTPTAKKFDATKAYIPDTIPADAPYQHGQLAPFGNQTWKWHQVAHGMWQGIDPNDWNDDIHVKNDTKLDISESIVAAQSVSLFAPAGESDLEARELNGFCAAAANCGIAALDYSNYCIQGLIGAYTTAAANKFGSKAIWGFLNQPFVATLVGGIGAGVTAGYVGSQTYSKLVASQCSTQNTDQDAINNAMLAALNEIRERFATVTVTDSNGNTGTIDVSAIASGSTQSTAVTCGAPVQKRDVPSEVLSRMARWLPSDVRSEIMPLF